eukprot:gene36427-44187_t
MNKGVVGGLDVGVKHLGIAIYDPAAESIAPLKTIRLPTLQDSNLLYEGPYVVDYLKLGQTLQSLVNVHRIQAFLVGFPLSPTSAGQTPPLCRFITKLVKLTPVKAYTPSSQPPQELCVSFWDERNSTKEARELAKMWKLDVRVAKDSLSACVILKSWLEAGGMIMEDG